MSNTDRLHGKTIVAIGDSLFHGSKDCKGNTWLEMMAKRHEMTLYNYGQNGNTMAVQHTEEQVLPPMCVRYADMAAPTISVSTYRWAVSTPPSPRPSAAHSISSSQDLPKNIPAPAFSL